MTIPDLVFIQLSFSRCEIPSVRYASEFEPGRTRPRCVTLFRRTEPKCLAGSI